MVFLILLAFFWYKCAMQKYLSWVEISKSALAHNAKLLRERIDSGRVGEKCVLSACVKANAYGHGLVETSKVFLESGVDWLDVNAIYEAEALRKAGVTAPIYVMGYTLMEDLYKAFDLDVRLVVYDKEIVRRLGEIAEKSSVRPLNLHIKVETGNNRQGVRLDDLINFAKYIQSFKGLRLEGIATHFANIEDTTDHSYAFSQVEKFKKAKEILVEAGISVPMMHCANSAATILFPETHFDMVRSGISTYGMWPSNETRVSYRETNGGELDLMPAFTWKSVVAQVKTVPAGEFIGYGCTFKTTRDVRMAIVPIGYYDGYDRAVSNTAHVLIRGQRAKVLGRVCMNMMMVDVSDIADVSLEDEVVLVGAQEFFGVSDAVSVEQFASWASTINYEITTRVNERIPRLIVA